MRRHRGREFAVSAACATVAFILFSKVPGYDRLIGAEENFALHSALIPVAVALALRPRWIARPVVFVLMSVALGCSVAIGVRLFFEAIDPPVIVFPLIGSLVADSLLDERVWLVTNGIISLVLALGFYRVIHHYLRR
jgi:hypothetical protein